MESRSWIIRVDTDFPAIILFYRNDRYIWSMGQFLVMNIGSNTPEAYLAGSSWKRATILEYKNYKNYGI